MTSSSEIVPGLISGCIPWGSLSRERLAERERRLQQAIYESIDSKWRADDGQALVIRSVISDGGVGKGASCRSIGD